MLWDLKGAQCQAAALENQRHFRFLRLIFTFMISEFKIC